MKGSSNSVRWRPGQKEKLEAIAEKCGLEVIDIVRNAADAVIKYAEAHGGVVPFPLDFEIGFTAHRLEHGPMILHELPRAESKSGSRAARSRTSK